MSLRITTFDGVDLTAQPPEAVTVPSSPPLGGQISLQCLVIEDGTYPYDYVAGTVSWNDGSLPVVYNGTTAGTLTLDLTRTLNPGDYTVSVTAHNYRTPAWETINVNFQFVVTVISTTTPQTEIVFGPILPKDEGYPNPQQWNFDRGSNLDIIASSVKALLTTSKGERIMNPDYGTNLSTILFELQGDGIETLVQQEIVDALTKWEPRAALQFLTVNREGRQVVVDATFVSKLDQQNFAIPLVFNN